MNNPKKTHNETAQPLRTEAIGATETLATLYTDAVERLAEAQKKSIDLIKQQGVESAKTASRATRSFVGDQELFPVDLSLQFFERVADAEKVAIDLFVQQTRVFSGMATDRTAMMIKSAETAMGLAQQAVERVVEFQKKPCEYTSEQARDAFARTKQALETPDTSGEATARSFKRGMDVLVETQKELLDIAIKPFQPVH